MEHGTYQVDVLDGKGSVIGSKARRDINKEADIYHAIYVFIITPERELLLSVIPPREDLPNLYVRQYGATMATIRRSGETAHDAAVRGISRELFIDDAEPVLVSQGMEQTDDGRRVLASVFYMEGPVPDSYSVIDIGQLESMSRAKLDGLLSVRPERVSPTLRLLWKKYSSKLPL
ncbi:hypothetical protein JNJ66_06930 [Candidatus Saccharibacteria bacterium]|nr:hypothetical protein [Candidatus Saccharibacteria bacterium]